MIIRSPKNKNFTVISNHYLEDTSLSWKAKGILSYLLSKPDTWDLYIKNIVNSGSDGTTAVRSAVTELEKAGYIQKDMVRAKNGKITGTEYIIFESPTLQGEVLSDDQPPTTPEQITHRCGISNNEKQTCGQPQFSNEVLSVLEVQPNVLGPRVSPEKNHIRETQIRETAPIVNTDSNQLLMGDTTTASPELKPEPEVVTKPEEQPSSYPAVSEINNLFDLIPQRFRQPMVESLLNRALSKHTALEVEEAIAYASDNVRGGHMQFKAYLDKTLRGGFAVGYLAAREVPDVRVVPSWGSTGKYPNGTITGSKRMDTNCAVAADFLREMKGGIS